MTFYLRMPQPVPRPARNAVSNEEETPAIQYSYRWGASAWTPWVDVENDSEVEVHAGFFLKARVKPSRCPSRWELNGDQVMQCERSDHSGPGEDPIHEGTVPNSDRVIRWSGPVKRMFPTWDGRTPEGA